MEPQQQRALALALLVSGKSADEISEELDTHRTTLWRWCKQPDFIAGWNQMIKQSKEKQIQLLLDLQQQAFNVLRECLSSQNELLRFRAAIAIVEKVEVMPDGSLYADEIHHKQQQDEKFRQLTDL